jgi:Zn finger protein HypA/HybF involved in hydrogenase expression
MANQEGKIQCHECRGYFEKEQMLGAVCYPCFARHQELNRQDILRKNEADRLAAARKNAQRLPGA